MSATKQSGAPNKQPFDALAKVAVIGDSSVGKTNILLRYVNSDYQMTHITTIGIDFKVKTLVMDGFRLKMQIWDTAGQERFRNLSGTIYQGAQAIILVYSVSSRKTFENMEKWVKDITDKAHGSILLAVVGNKCDLKEQREVSLQDGMMMAKKLNAEIFMQTSAKQGTNIDQLFEKIGRRIKQKFQLNNPPQKKPQKASKQGSEQKKATTNSSATKQSMKTKDNSVTITTVNNVNVDGTKSNNNKIKLTNADVSDKDKKKKGCC